MQEWQERMHSVEFSEWRAWAEIRGGFGESRADLRNGILCALVANVASAMAGHKGKAKPTDFMPFYKEPEQPAEAVEKTRQQISVLQTVFGVKAS